VSEDEGNGKADRVTAGGPYRVFLCDDVADIRMLMRFALEEDPELEVVGEAEDGLSGVEGIVETRPDVVLLDLSMPGLDGLEVITRVREAAPDTGILVFSGFAAERMSVVALALGADGYLEKGEPLETVREAVRDLASKRRNHRE
jgi:DNA-binding NarL/FixJ family response regulator